jgi:hypothetical protein
MEKIAQNGVPATSSPKVGAISPAEWNVELARFSDASNYQSWQYGEISWGKSQVSHFVLETGGKPAAMAQMRIVKTPVFHAGVAYARWAPLFQSQQREADVELFRQALTALRDEYAVRGRFLLRVIPNVYEMDRSVNAARQVLEDLGFRRAANIRPYNTSRVDLTATVEELRKGLRQRWRNKLKHAEAEGFTVTIGTSDEMYAKFHRAYDEMMARKRFETTVSVEEFALLQTALPPQLKMRVLICEKEGVLFNALVVAPAGDTGIYLLAATSNAGLAADGAFLLQWRAMQMLKAEGYRWYDLGGINPETNPGVYQFKSGMGGTDTAQIGVFDYCSSPLSALCVRGGETLVRARARLRKMFRRQAANPSSVDGKDRPRELSQVKP